MLLGGSRRVHKLTTWPASPIYTLQGGGREEQFLPLPAISFEQQLNFPPGSLGQPLPPQVPHCAGQQAVDDRFAGRIPPAFLHSASALGPGSGAGGVGPAGTGGATM